MDVRRSVQDPMFDAETNILGTLNVLRTLSELYVSASARNLGRVIAVMGAKGAVEIIFRSDIGDAEKIAARTKEYEDRFLSPFIAAERGYTVCIDKAGRYSEDEARSICREGLCIAVPFAVATTDHVAVPGFADQPLDLRRVWELLTMTSPSPSCGMKE